MPTPLAVGNVAEVRFQCLSANQVSQNVLHYKVTSLVDGAVSDQQLADQFSLIAAPLYQDILSTQDEYLGLRLQKIAPSPKATYVISTAGAGIGETDSHVLPTQASAGIVKLTDEADRRFRGFVFLPFFTEVDNDVEGIPAATAKTKMANWAEGLLVEQTIAVGGATITLIPVIHSRGDGTVLVVDAPITGWRLQDWWVTHKSRALNRRGDILGP